MSILDIDAHQCLGLTSITIDGILMSRIQLALNVSNLENAIDFYSRLFDASPNKVRPGYANFTIDEPPLKLVLIENSAAAGGSINHLGIEVFSTEEVAAATARLHNEGMSTEIESSTTCCYALQDKVWVSGPDAERWEVYTVLSDSDTFASTERSDSECCPPTVSIQPVTLRAQ